MADDFYKDDQAESETEAASEGEFYSESFRQGASRDRRAPRHLWLISYSDFMTILMIFFLAMYGYTHLAKLQLMRNQQNPRNVQEFQKTISEMKGKLGENLTIAEEQDKVVFQFGEQILFKSGSAKLEPQSKRAIEDLAKSIKLSDGIVVVQGHTDNVPIKSGRYPSNWELSAARAFSMIEALTQAGIAPDRLSAWGFGEHRPLVANTSAESKAKNRRIEVVIVKKGIGEMTHGG